jgi:kynurenine formamidase
MTRIVDLSMTVEECDSAPFAPDEKYFKLKPIITWEDKGFVSNTVQMTVHVGTHIDSPHHFFRDKPSIEQLPLEAMIGKAVVLDLTAKGKARAIITPDDLSAAEQKLNAEGIEIAAGGILFLRTDWPKGHDTSDPKWWNDSPYLTKEAAQWVVGKKPSVVGFDFAQEEKGADYQQADQILDARAPNDPAARDFSDRESDQPRPDRFQRASRRSTRQMEDGIGAGAGDRDPR